MTFDLTKISARRAVMAQLVQSWARVRGGAYDSHRGVVNFTTYEWGERDRAVSVFMDDETFGRVQNEGTVAFHVFARLRDRTPGDGGNIDDSVIDEIKDDAVTVIQELIDARDTKGDSLIYLFLENTATMQEAYDLKAGVEGVLILFDIRF